VKRLHALQYLRAIAALIVVYSHAAIQITEWKSLLPYTGAYGVDIFFVISGFIMVYITKPNDTPVNFMVNRVRRVVPLYWFFTLLMGIILFTLPSLFKTGEFSWAALFQSLFFIPHYSLQNPEFVWPIVAPGWSLNYEMYFYCLFAMSLVLAPQFRVAFIIAAISLIWAVFNIIGSNAAIPRFIADPTVFEFVAGMLLAVAWKRGFVLSNLTGWVFFIAGFILATVAPDTMHHWLRISIPSTMIVVGCLFLKVPVSKFGLMLGDASYAIYLSHIFVLGGLRFLVPADAAATAANAWLFVLASVLISTLIGIVVHFVIDNWLLREERLNLFKGARSSTDTTPEANEARR